MCLCPIFAGCFPYIRLIGHTQQKLHIGQCLFFVKGSSIDFFVSQINSTRSSKPLDSIVKTVLVRTNLFFDLSSRHIFDHAVFLHWHRRCILLVPRVQRKSVRLQNHGPRDLHRPQLQLLCACPMSHCLHFISLYQLFSSLCLLFGNPDLLRPQCAALCVVPRDGLQKLFADGFKKEIIIGKRFGETAGLYTSQLVAHINAMLAHLNIWTGSSFWPYSTVCGVNN